MSFPSVDVSTRCHGSKSVSTDVKGEVNVIVADRGTEDDVEVQGTGGIVAS
jgi:hypothetical protein